MIRGWLLVLAACLPALVWAAQPEPPAEWRYTIRPGDTLIGIGQSYLKQPHDWVWLQRLNHVKNPFFLMPGASLRIPFDLLKQQPVPATSVQVTGQVEVELPGKAASPLTQGVQLPSGSVITTGIHGSAVIGFADGSRLVLQPGSRLKLDTLSVYAGGGMVDTRVRLQQGRAELAANPRKQPGNRLQVITPSAVAAVRGTIFRIAADDAATREETVEGLVAVASAGIEVSAGAVQGTLAEAGKPPLPPVPLLPAPDVAALPPKFDREPLRFPLPVLAGAERWAAQVARDPDFESIVQVKEATAPVLSIAGLPDGKYFLRLRGIDKLGLQGLDSVHGFELDARPFPPMLDKPVDATRVREATPEFSWMQPVEASRYRVQISSQADFSQVVAEGEPAQIAWRPSALQEGAYYWRVASIEASGEQGPFSDARRFTYKAGPGAPDLGKAGILFDEKEIRVQLPPLPSDQRYQIVFSRDADLKAVVWQGQKIGQQLVLPKPDGGTYYLAARATEADGTAGPYSTQVIQVPARPWWPYLFFLAPLLLL